ncbi:MAG: OsmC family protein [Deltaproteobacteria bacterium]|nr:OsmC family protein [Deltaproteobacteria bacterium]
MHPFPHQYLVRATGKAEGLIAVSAPAVPTLQTAAPAEFGGPGDQWSPETLLVAAAADCFILTFRAIAGASKLAWNDLTCDADGKLDRVDGVTRFTGLTLRARLSVPSGTDTERARRLLEKAEKNCLITRSLAFPIELICELAVA